MRTPTARDASISGGLVYRGSQFPAASYGKLLLSVTVRARGLALSGGGLPAQGATDPIGLA